MMSGWQKTDANFHVIFFEMYQTDSRTTHTLSISDYLCKTATQSDYVTREDGLTERTCVVCTTGAVMPATSLPVQNLSYLISQTVFYSKAPMLVSRQKGSWQFM